MEQVKADSDILLLSLETAYGLGPSHVKSWWPRNLRGSTADLVDYLARAIGITSEGLHLRYNPASIDWDVQAELKIKMDKDTAKNPPVSGIQRLLAALVVIKCKLALPSADIHPGVVTCALKLAADRVVGHMASNLNSVENLKALFSTCPKGDKSRLIFSRRTIRGEGTNLDGIKFMYESTENDDDGHGEQLPFVNLSAAVSMLSHPQFGTGKSDILHGSNAYKYHDLWSRMYQLAQRADKCIPDTVVRSLSDMTQWRTLIQQRRTEILNSGVGVGVGVGVVAEHLLPADAQSVKVSSKPTSQLLSLYTPAGTGESGTIAQRRFAGSRSVNSGGGLPTNSSSQMSVYDLENFPSSGGENTLNCFGGGKFKAKAGVDAKTVRGGAVVQAAVATSRVDSSVGGGSGLLNRATSA